MNLHINYYNTLGLRNNSTDKEIKKSYYDLSKHLHPDKINISLEADNDSFILIAEAYKILSTKDLKAEYDKKSKYGKDYDENDLSVLFNNYSFKSDVENYSKDQYEEWKDREELNILVYVDDTFNGSVEYERYVHCKTCHGSGMDESGKVSIGSAANVEYYFDNIEEAEDFIEIENIKDYTMNKISSGEMIIKLNKLKESGNLSEEEYNDNKIKYENGDKFILLKVKNNSKSSLFELSDDCEFCDGIGKWKGEDGSEVDCFYCHGSGRINGKECSKCKGQKRILGKQKLSGIKMKSEDKDFRVECMGHVSRDIPGKVGALWLIRKTK